MIYLLAGVLVLLAWGGWLLMRPKSPAASYRQELTDWYVDEPFIKPLGLPAVKILQARKGSDDATQ